MAEPGAPALLPVCLADLTAKQLACLLVAPPTQLLIDCGGLLMPHRLGVCRFVAQLLQMRLRGTRLWLCNVHPGLQRCLQQLELADVFHLPA
jgi:anti-anti-sigma regulatory factor